MEDIESIARSGDMVTVDGGSITDAITIDGCESIAGLLKLERPLKIVVDGGNGIIGTMFQHLAPKLPGLTIIPMYFDPDGRFPNHDANPRQTTRQTYRIGYAQKAPTSALRSTVMATAARWSTRTARLLLMI